jgi:UDP-N-acetylglucosamine diphosphorylase / glucose-1-phosphate thymidylyltransferase / UDP-N-acetylgalactosamine diphosphorylase / glucosamine-1-phosphate N-acetyltransferase / galactosamine-1-phosphate N-acetyltransferase
VNLDAVVMAAGEGRRLRPLTERWPKPVLPVDGRPVIGTLLRQLGAAGFERVTVVVGHLGDQVRALVGDGSAFGIAVRYAEQPSPDGSGDALRCALAAGARLPALVAAADTVFRPGDLAAAARRWLDSGFPVGIAVREVPGPELGERSPVRVEGDRVVELGGAPGGGSLAAAPLWFVGESLGDRLAELPGPPFELAEALRHAIGAGEPVAALEIGPTRDLTRPADLVTRNFPYLG